MTITHDIEASLVTLVRAVAKAEILPRFRRLGDLDVSVKSGPEDLVTEADLHAEAAIAAGVRTLLPDALIVGEEAAETEPGLLAQLGDAPLSVIIDPVDGTWNFAKGLTTFGVILAVAMRGETVFGLLYDPVMDDWIVTRRGEGTWYVSATGDRRRLMLDGSDATDLTGMVPLFYFPTKARLTLAGDLPGFRRIWSVRCSCHEYRTLAFGGADFTLSTALKPWDHAAGALAIVEAGGAVGLLDGRDYRASITSGGYLVTARSAVILARVRERMVPILAES
ncbi:MAG: inositol monophosphatase family protein [Pseudomonadota bacterium]